MGAIIDGRMGECATSVVIEDVDEVAEASARCDVSGGAGLIMREASSIARVDAFDGEDADAEVIGREASSIALAGV